MCNVRAYTGSGLYSFANGSDIRYLAFSTVLASTEFSNMAFSYRQYRIRGIRMTAVPVAYFVYTNPTPGLYANVLLATTPANPTNLSVVQSDTSRLYNPSAATMETCEWNLRQASTVTNTWLDIAAAITVGEIVIGCNPSFGFSSSAIAFDLKIDVLVEFTTPT